MGTTSELPFPLIDQDLTHPSGCPDDCGFALHLTEPALSTLRLNHVSEDIIRQALDTELRVHRLGKRYPGKSSGGWTPRVDATLRALGIDPAICDAARAQVDRAAATRALKLMVPQAERDAAARARMKAWAEQNRDKLAANSRAYRARKRLELVK